MLLKTYDLLHGDVTLCICGISRPQAQLRLIQQLCLV